MDIGIPREQRSDETRVAVTPMGVYTLTEAGHRVFVESAAGADAGFSDEEYDKAGATIVFSPPEVYGRADMVAKVQPPELEEIELMNEGAVLFSALQLGARVDEALQALMQKKVAAIGFEMLEDAEGEFPVMRIISEMVGYITPSIAGRLLSFYEGGRGIALANLPGIPAAAAVIIGAGKVGITSARSFAALGVQTHLLDTSVSNLRCAEAVVPEVITHMAEQPTIEKACTYADIIVTAAYVHGEKPPSLITEDMVKTMKPGAVILDIAIDQGGCVETSHPTTHTDPAFKMHEVTHYCVPNIASSAPRTCSYAINNGLKPYLAKVAGLGIAEAAKADEGLKRGIYFFGGECTKPAICKIFNLKCKDINGLTG